MRSVVSLIRSEKTMTRWFIGCITVLAFAFGLAGAAAQDQPPLDLPKLELTAAQKQTIYQSVTNQPDAKKSTVPDTFRAAPGANVPASVTLTPMPKTIVQLIPRSEDFQVALVSNQVLIVQPKGRRIVEVIREGS
jgi:hypothetical protein